MPDEDIPPGEVYSRVYHAPALAEQDSERMRRRLYELWRQEDGDTARFAPLLMAETGVSIRRQYHGFNIELFFLEAELRDVFDAITHFWRSQAGTAKQRWAAGVARIFSQEHVAYRLTEVCTVRRTFDDAFDFVVQAAVAGLGRPKHNNSRHKFQAAQDAWSRSQPDFLGAVRSLFDACENTFKQTFEGADRLAGDRMEAHLKPVIEARYADRALDVAKLLIKHYREWVAAMHFYRHADGTPDPAPPPPELSVALITTGIGFLRYLLEMDSYLELRRREE